MVAIALALTASLAYGTSDFLGGRKSRALPLLSVLVVSQVTALVAIAAVVLATGEASLAGDVLLYGSLAGIWEAVGVAALYRGLAVGTMSIVAPIAATAPLVAVVAAVVLGELPTALQGAGIAIALGGIGLISRSRSSRESRPREVTASILFGGLAAVGFGSFYVALDAASEESVTGALLASRLTVVTILLATLACTHATLGLRRAEVPAIALIGILIMGADSLYAVASTLGRLSIVVVLSSLYPLVTMLLARVFLGERLSRLQILGVASCLFGVLLIAQ